MLRTASIVSILFLLFLAITGFAGTTGSIAGKVTDNQGNPMVGATVMIMGTSFGAMTDANGEYFIINLSPGTYTLKASMVGMGSAMSPSIQVVADATTTYDFTPGTEFDAPELLVESEIEAEPEVEPDPAPVPIQTLVMTEDPCCGRLMTVDGEGNVVDLPLEHTNVVIEVSGMLQRATVLQVYGNPFENPIEAVYTFPLPQNGAVDRMDMYIGDVLIHGQIYERELAQTMYAEAINAGYTAGLLEQERPNIFTQTVGNILPGDSIIVEISYVAPVKYDEGKYELVFPMVVGPRFIPGVPITDSLSGWANPTARVPDADRITPHVVPEGTRAGYDIDLSVSIKAGVAVQTIESVNHEVLDLIAEDGTAFIALAQGEAIPDRDFVLRYTTASDRIEFGVLTTNTDLGGHFMLIIQPDVSVDRSWITPKELFFVMDCSGSMSGQPIEVAKETVRQFMCGMNPDDTFQILRFSERTSSMSDAPLAYTDANIATGIDYINSLYGSGGTQMIEGVRAAVGYPEDPERMRFIIFLTDGYVGNEVEILGELQSTLGENSRLFSVGVGSSPNRYLIEGLAEEGLGQAYYISLNEDPSEAVERIYQKINDPYLVGININWGGLDVHDIYPSRIPDLFAAEPLVIIGRYSVSGNALVRISGEVDMRPWHRNFRVDLPDSNEDNSVIATLWARMKIHELKRMSYDTRGIEQHTPEAVNQITELALAYQILSDYTAFLAVSEEVRTDPDGNPVRIEVAVNMPDGVSYEGVFGTPGGIVPLAGAAVAPARTLQSGGGLAPEAIGNTLITVTDGRGMILRNVTSSICITGSELHAGNYGSGIPSVFFVSANPFLGLPSSEIKTAIEAVLDRILEKYESIIESLGETEVLPLGLVTAVITFRDDGSVSSVEIASDRTGNSDLAEGVADALEEVVIPAPPDGGGRVYVSISMVFY